MSPCSPHPLPQACSSLVTCSGGIHSHSLSLTTGHHGLRSRAPQPSSSWPSCPQVLPHPGLSVWTCHLLEPSPKWGTRDPTSFPGGVRSAGPRTAPHTPGTRFEVPSALLDSVPAVTSTVHTSASVSLTVKWLVAARGRPSAAAEHAGRGWSLPEPAALPPGLTCPPGRG